MTSRRAWALYAFAVLLLVPASLFGGTVIYVDVNAPGPGTPDGTSWPTAFDSVQDGLSAATSGDVIYVAQGVYRPGTNVTDTILLKSGVHLKGGFAGVTETDPNVHDPDEYPTILSGDLTDNDTECAQNDSLNSLHVVTAGNVNANTILEGFVITRGNAGFSDGGGLEITSPGAALQVVDCKFVCNRASRGGGVDHGGSDSEYHGCTFESNVATNVGGGLWSGDDDEDSVLTLTDCTFLGNEAASGGGVYAEFIADATYQGCVFTGNAATDNSVYGGGACYHNVVEDVRILGCAFESNTSAAHAGAIFDFLSTELRILDTTFLSNTSAYEGGAVKAGFSVVATLQRCTFTDNESTTLYGGAIDIAKGPMNVVDCWFENNRAVGDGGGGGAISSHNHGVSVTRLINNRFVGNQAASNGYGGAVFGYAGDLRAVNCLLNDNTAGEGGGGYFSSMDVAFLNCTITENIATSSGGGLVTGFSTTNVRNCIVWDNEAGGASGIAAQWVLQPSTTTVTYSDVQDADLGGVPFSGGANQNANPLFVNPALYMYRLKRISPCVDTGTSSPFSATEHRDGFDVDGDLTTNEPTPDLDRLERIIDYPIADGAGGYVDMGAYEKQVCCEGDLDHDGDIDDDDVDIFDDYLLDPPSDPESLCLADLDENGLINGLDIAGFIVLYEEDKLCNELRAGNQDCDRSGFIDAYDIGNELSEDCNGNLIPDKCEHDCNCNGIDDGIDLEGTGDDCNENDVLDECDIAAQTSEDVNENGIPDECE